MPVLEREQFIPKPVEEVFPFFAEARNLGKITPPFMRFRFLTEGDIDMKPGALIDYSIALYGLPMKWRTKITAFDPPHRFIDEQIRGPYKRWHHEHTFESVPGGTKMKDRVEYEVGFGPFGAIAHALFVKRMLRRIFDYRVDVIREMFGG